MPRETRKFNSPAGIPTGSDASGVPDVGANSGDTGGSQGGSVEPIGDGSEAIGFEAIDPASAGVEPISGDNGGEPRSRRGRKPGSKNRPRTATGEGEAVSESLVDLTGLLLSLHQMGASLLNIAELELDKDEAKKLADGIKEVSKHYPVALNPKHVAIANLVVVAGGIYGSRIMAYNMRCANDRANRPHAVPQPIKKEAQKTNGFPLPTQAAPAGANQAPSAVWGMQSAVEPDREM